VPQISKRLRYPATKTRGDERAQPQDRKQGQSISAQRCNATLYSHVSHARRGTAIAEIRRRPGTANVQHMHGAQRDKCCRDGSMQGGDGREKRVRPDTRTRRREAVPCGAAVSRGHRRRACDPRRLCMRRGRSAVSRGRRGRGVAVSRDHRRLGTACELREFRDGECDVGDRLDDVEGVQG